MKEEGYWPELPGDPRGCRRRVRGGLALVQSREPGTSCRRRSACLQAARCPRTCQSAVASGGAVRHDRKDESLRHGKDLDFGLPLQGLYIGCNALSCAMPPVSEAPQRMSDLPSGEVRAGRVGDLSLPDEVVERAQAIADVSRRPRPLRSGRGSRRWAPGAGASLGSPEGRAKNASSRTGTRTKARSASREECVPRYLSRYV